MHFLPYLDAEGTGLVLIENEVPTLLINTRLHRRLTYLSSRSIGNFPEQHHGTEDEPQDFEEYSDQKFHAGYREWIEGGRAASARDFMKVFLQQFPGKRALLR